MPLRWLLLLSTPLQLPLPLPRLPPRWATLARAAPLLPLLLLAMLPPLLLRLPRAAPSADSVAALLCSAARKAATVGLRRMLCVRGKPSLARQAQLLPDVDVVRCGLLYFPAIFQNTRGGVSKRVSEVFLWEQRQDGIEAIAQVRSWPR